MIIEWAITHRSEPALDHPDQGQDRDLIQADHAHIPGLPAALHQDLLPVPFLVRFLAPLLRALPLVLPPLPGLDLGLAAPRKMKILKQN